VRRTAALLLLVVVATVAGACQDPGATPPVNLGGVRDTADQTMFGVRLMLADRGIQRAQMEADTAFTFEDNTKTELRNVRTLFFTETGLKNGTLTSREGTYNVRSGNMEARGNVVVVSEDGRRLETQQLRYDPARNEISSDSAFVLTEPTQRVSGIGFRADPNLNNVNILRAASGSTTRSVRQPDR
jgi:LPS export ABC transporter protein LptC